VEVCRVDENGREARRSVARLEPTTRLGEDHSRTFGVLGRGRVKFRVLSARGLSRRRRGCECVGVLRAISRDSVGCGVETGVEAASDPSSSLSSSSILVVTSEGESFEAGFDVDSKNEIANSMYSLTVRQKYTLE